ncbi:MAG TPA: hypothetical protein VFN55_04540 [Solirubrobacteraceae bacterium]|nr:hypothetical protein [Solirubrobacteraceae bacterium]
MLFDSDEYIVLSRSGRVPLSRTRPVRPPAPTPPEPARRRPRGRDVVRGRVRVLRDLRGGLRAAWTAFGPGSAEL